MSKEEWRAVTDWPGYFVSNLGRVRGPRRVLRPSVTKLGYHRVTFTKPPNTRQTMSVHRLVVIAFLGVIPEQLCVNHKDGVKANNTVDNLEVISPSENTRHAYALGLMRGPRGHRPASAGQNNGNSKLTPEIVLDIRRKFATGNCTKESLGKLYGVADVTIGAIVHRKIWRHI